jgi:uncharacterized protein (DUF1501 family)
MPACHCKDYSRSALLRGAAAKAGAGLRPIEAGMPVPAGTGLSRRSFIARTGGLALAVFGGGALRPAAWDEAIAAAAAAGPERVLVSIFMSGGVDSLSMLAPLGDARYATLRPTLGVPDSGVAEDVFTEDDRLRWHPDLAPIRDLHRAGKVTVVPAIGYDDSNQSHFTSRHYWEVGEIDPVGRIGWMGRFLDRHGSPDNPLQGLSLDHDLAPGLAAGSVPVAAVAAPESYRLWTRDVWNASLNADLNRRFGALGALPTGDGELAAARNAARQTIALQDQLAPLSSRSPAWGLPASYPGGTFPRRLAVLAEMLGMGLPLRCVALDANGGYDTHDSQGSTLPGQFSLFARSIAAFQADLEARGLADRVLVQVWSEFGRRARENGGGTDHGAGGISLLIGARARGEMVGEFPGLTNLDYQGNLRHTVDFRHVYKHVVQDWLGVDATGIVPDAAKFSTPLALVE